MIVKFIQKLIVIGVTMVACSFATNLAIADPVALARGTLIQKMHLDEINRAPRGSTLTFTIHNGGTISTAAFSIRRANYKNLNIRLNGRFYSAGTMWLGAKNVCVTPSSEFYTHYAFDIHTKKVSMNGSRMLEKYQPPLLANQTRWAFHENLPGNPFRPPVTGRQLIDAGQIKECI